MTEETKIVNHKGLRGDQVSGLVLLALALYVGWMNRVYPVGTLSEPGPGYVPMLLAIFLGAMGLIVALRGGSSTPLKEMEWTEAGRAALILIGCGVAVFAFERLGYRITIAALLVFFLGVLERRKPMMVVTVSFGFSLLSFYVFAKLLRVPLPVSPWGF